MLRNTARKGEHGAAAPQAQLLPASADVTGELRPPTHHVGAGPGQVDWSKLVAAISSELLSFDEAPDPTAFVASPRAAAASAAAAAQDVLQPAAGGLQHQSSIASQIGSPRSASAGGERLDINSGGCSELFVVGRPLLLTG